jgi:hypothetical protein
LLFETLALATKPMAKLADELSVSSVVSALSMVLFACCESGMAEASAVSQPQKKRDRAIANNIKNGFILSIIHLSILDEIALNLLKKLPW